MAKVLPEFDPLSAQASDKTVQAFQEAQANSRKNWDDTGQQVDPPTEEGVAAEIADWQEQETPYKEDAAPVEQTTETTQTQVEQPQSEIVTGEQAVENTHQYTEDRA